MGGEILFIEATRMPGKGSLLLTGSLGDVMKESAQTAVSYLRSQAKSLGIDLADYGKFDIHIHVPAGATPKDGPSAGVTLVAALASLLTRRRVRSDVAMTGEISLRGRVLRVGGIKEKVLAAARFGIKQVILPGPEPAGLERSARGSPAKAQGAFRPAHLRVAAAGPACQMRRFFCRFRSLWSVLLLAAATAGLAQAKSELGPTPPIPVEEGRKQARELVENLLKLKPAASSTERLLVKITDADDNRTEVPVTFSVLLTATNYLSIYETTSVPARRSKLTIASAENAPNEYLLSEPSEAPPRKLSPGELMSPFAGSDFWVADLGLEFLHWPQQRITKKEMRRSLFCNVLESINPEPTPSRLCEGGILGGRESP